MADILPRHYIYGIIVFVFIMVGGIAILAEFNNANANFVDNTKYVEFNESFHKLNEITESIETIENNIVTDVPDPGVWGVLNSLIQSSWQTLKLLFNSFRFMKIATAATTKIFGIPAWIPGLISLFITVLLAFAIYSAIFQREI